MTGLSEWRRTLEPLLSFMMEKAKERGMLIAFNPSPFDDEIADLPLSYVDWFFLNEIEGECLTGENRFPLILDEMRKLYPEASVVLTCGKSGAYAMHEGNVYYQEIVDYPVVDTTGAGDTFSGYFLSSVYHNGKSVEDSLFYASKASGIAVSRNGAMDAIPFSSEVI